VQLLEEELSQVRGIGGGTAVRPHQRIIFEFEYRGEFRWFLVRALDIQLLDKDKKHA
jgi:hypothetical protein